MLVFDNLSGLPPWLSDSLCRLASGGGFAVRQLYTDQDEMLFDAARPVILNGIEDVITRPDLADRARFLTLPSISQVQRRREQELWREFELARARLLGALLDAASHGLRTLPHVRLDFAQWAAACESALWPSGTFSRAYASNRRAAIESMVDADPVAACVREIMAERSTWTGSATDLLRAEADLARDPTRTSPGWPKNSRALAGHLRRAQTALRTLGIEILFGREGRAGTRIIRMSRTHENTVAIVSSVGDDWSRPGLKHSVPGPETGRQERRRC